MEYFIHTNDNHDFAVDADALENLTSNSLVNTANLKHDYIALREQDKIVAILNMSFIKAIVAGDNLIENTPVIDWGDDKDDEAEKPD